MPATGSRWAFAATLILGLSAQPASVPPRERALAPWHAILESVGLWPARPEDALVFFALPGDAPPPGWAERVERGAWLVLEGDSALAGALGFQATPERVFVTSVVETASPSLDIVWAKGVETPRFRIPPQASVFTRDRWTGAPLVAGLKRGAGGVLWTALSPGENGFARFPFLLHALTDLGLQPVFRTNRLWAFFDSSYRIRADIGFLAERWRAAGIRGLHVAAWHFHEPDQERDRYLHELIAQCHLRGILVFAWLELPHVSEEFWRAHPGWREKTALGQDAHLDWRKLMNLADPDCYAAAAAGVRELLLRFDWDGVNLAELYFESLQGQDNPSRFTPMNGVVRREFQARHGFDPADLFDTASPRSHKANPVGLRLWLDYRSWLVHRLQVQWIEELERVRAVKPGLALVLTHIDDQFDPAMRDALGADARSLMPLLARPHLTFLAEDPATVWNLDAERYGEIALRYGTLTEHGERLAIDVNIVDRYQDVYPTKQQTGTELYRLARHASLAFPRVALYSENSIQARDVAWLSSAAAGIESWFRRDGRLVVESRFGTGVRWEGPVLVNGKPWPVGTGDTVWLPAGRHTVERAASAPRIRVLELSAQLIRARTLRNGLELVYRSGGRALAILDRTPTRVWVDGVPMPPAVAPAKEAFTLFLPEGEHVLRVDAPD